MFSRAAAASTLLLIGFGALSLDAPGGQALAQFYPPPVQVYPAPAPYPTQGYPAQAYPRPGRPVPPAAIDDDQDDLGPPTSFFPGAVAPPPPAQYGARPIYPPQNGAYAAPPPGYPLPPGAIPEEDAARGPIQGAPGQSTGALSVLPPDYQPETGPRKELPPQFRRTMVEYRTKEPVGTIIIDTPNTYLYLVLGNGKAMRYGIGVGREGFTWAGTERISRMAQWPDWHPPPEMIERQPYLPRFMAGGEGNPLGARALYLGNTLYRIHGTNQPSTIGTFVSSGCIRLTNEDVSDLYGRVQVGTRVVVLPGTPPETADAAYAPAAPGGYYAPSGVQASPLGPPPVRTR
jgi:lipoprotein-anchoring transpeptidase ErfK/SrfK